MNNKTNLTTNFEEECQKTLGKICLITIQDSVWKSFGYKKMPDRGAWFDIFISRRKLELERILRQELWLVSFSTVFNWYLNKKNSGFRKNFTAMALEMFLGCSGGKMYDVHLSLNFKTRKNLFGYIIDGSSQYSKNDFSEFGHVFISRCGEQLTQDIPAVWLFGMDSLFSNTGIFNWIIPPLMELDAKSNKGEVLNIREKWFLRVLNEMSNETTTKTV